MITRISDGHRVRVQFESVLELLAIQTTATLPNFVDLVEQPFEVTFIDSIGKPGRHRIDLLIVLADDLVLVTDKNFTRAQAQNALRYIKFTKHADIEADNAVARVITSISGIIKMNDLAALTGLAGRGYRAAFRAAFRGQLEVRLGGDVRIGRQIGKGCVVAGGQDLAGSLQYKSAALFQAHETGHDLNILKGSG